ncbi:MAG: hypothetical protein KDD50_09735 [Bdellovibrionales bacterium]|nr:hypothetical protein [Bdellovibrionales bacterium]
MFKVLSIFSLFVAFSVNAQAEMYLSKTVSNVEGYVVKYMDYGDGDLYSVHYAIGASVEDARSSADSGKGINGVVFLQNCNRDEFSKAGFTIPSLEKVAANLKVLEDAEKKQSKVRVSYWDNGHPLSGKCIIRLEAL